MPTTIRAVTGLLRACHPEPAAAVTAGSALLAVIAGRDARGVAAVAATVAASQLAVGWHNDWLDAERDAIARRRDKPIAAGDVSRETVAIGSVVAAATTVALCFLSGPAAAAAGIIGLFSALAYNWPLKFTILSPLPYSASFASLPAFIVLGLPGAPAPPGWLIAAGAALGAGAHFANVLPDLDDDARTGVRGLPHRLGRSWCSAGATTLLAVAAALIAFGPAGPLRPWALGGLCVALAVLVGGLYWQWRAPSSRAAFRAVIVVALIDVAMLLTASQVV